MFAFAFAIIELLQLIADALVEAWAAMDLQRRLEAWRHVVTHRDAIHQSIDVVWVRGGGDAT